MLPFTQQFTLSFPNFDTPVSALAAFRDLYRQNSTSSTMVQQIYSKTPQLANSVKSGLSANLSFVNQIMAAAMQGTEKVAQLNIATAKTFVDESGVIAKQLFSASNAAEARNFLSALPQPTVTKTVAYARHLTLITTETQAAVTRAAEEQMAQASRHFLSSIEELIDIAPAGTQNALEGTKAAISSANESVDQLAHSAIQVVDTAEATVHEIADQVVDAAEQASTAAARTRKKQGGA